MERVNGGLTVLWTGVVDRMANLQGRAARNRSWIGRRSGSACASSHYDEDTYME